jgi:hypothetical protein
MKANIRRIVDAVSKIPGIFRFAFILWKSEPALPEAYQQSLLSPAPEIISVEGWFPGINLFRVKTRQIKHLIPEIQIIHLHYFCYAAKIVHYRNKIRSANPEIKDLLFKFMNIFQNF